MSFFSPEPLTEANLQLLTGSMPPKKAHPSTPTNTPSQKSKYTASTNTKLPIHELLAANNMPVDDDEALRRHPGILQWAEEIQNGKRNSAMKTATEKKLMARRRKFERSNEDTFINQFMNALLQDEREKRDEREKLENWVKTSWDQDGLTQAWNQQFQKECIPQILAPDALTKKVLSANPRIKDPKPDITYGISSRLFSKEQHKTNRTYYQQTGICPGLWHPFFLVEAKLKGTIEDAEYQCVRGGAALVNAGQQLRYCSGVDADPDVPDIHTAVFSLAVTPIVALLHIHWAEKISDGETLFHMNHVQTYGLKNKGVGRQLRHDIDNILDWGTLTRKNQVDEMLNDIATREKNNTVRILPTPSISIADASAANQNNNEHDEGEDGDDKHDEDEDEVADEEDDDGGASQLMGSVPTQVPRGENSPAHKKRRTGSDQ